MARSDAYRFTVTSLDDPRLAELREFVSYTNSIREPGTERRRVSIRPRLGKKNPYAFMYRCQYQRSIKRSHAKHFDIYVHWDAR